MLNTIFVVGNSIVILSGISRLIVLKCTRMLSDVLSVSDACHDHELQVAGNCDRG